MFDIPKSVSDVERFVVDRIKESVYLDYKASAALDPPNRDELSKDVSSFANSDGGLLIYGIVERNNAADRVDAGVDNSKLNQERLENIIQSNITKRIEGLEISGIEISAGRSLYAIRIPKSYRGPHQASDKKYYKRYNFKAEPMEDYEINDVRNRRQTLPPLLSVDIEIEDGTTVFMIVANIGAFPAIDVSFTFSEQLVWYREDGIPAIFERGAKFFPPGRSYRFFYHGFSEVISDENVIPSKFDVEVSYIHPQVGQRITDDFHIDIKDYWNSSPSESEIHQHAATLKDAIGRLTEQIKKVNETLSQVATIGGATGLDLSITTLRNLRHVLAGEDRIEQINPSGCSYRVFMEVLGVDYKMAHQLRIFFRTPNQSKTLMEVEGMAEELAEKIKRFFSMRSVDTV